MGGIRAIFNFKQRCKQTNIERKIRKKKKTHTTQNKKIAEGSSVVSFWALASAGALRRRATVTRKTR